jgi:hypothetical protein
MRGGEEGFFLLKIGSEEGFFLLKIKTAPILPATINIIRINARIFLN